MRSDLKMSQRVLGEAVGVTRDVIKDIELGRARPFADVYLKIKELWTSALRIEEATGGQVTRMELLYPQEKEKAAD